MAWPLFLFSLHTAAEFFFVGIERLPLLEQVKTRKREIAVAVIGSRMGSVGLPLTAGGVLLPIRRSLSVGGLGLRVRMCVGGLLWLRHGNGSFGCRNIVCRLLIVETLIKGICRELFAESGAVQYRHGVVVDERNAVYAPLVGIAENNIYAAVLQLGCKIVLTR